MDNFAQVSEVNPDGKCTHHLRVHALEDELVVIAEWVRQHALVCLIVREQATRAHFHAIFATRKSEAQWRKDFKARFPHLEGNKHYSLRKIKSSDGIEDYICKGEKPGVLPEVMEASRSWTQSHIQRHHETYWDRHQEEQVSTARAKAGSDSVISDHKGKTIVRTPTHIEKTALHLQSKYPDVEWRYNDITHRRIAYRAMMARLGEAGKGFDALILTRLFNGVMHQLCELESTDYFENLIVGS